MDAKYSSGTYGIVITHGKYAYKFMQNLEEEGKYELLREMMLSLTLSASLTEENAGLVKMTYILPEKLPAEIKIRAKRAKIKNYGAFRMPLLTDSMDDIFYYTEKKDPEYLKKIDFINFAIEDRESIFADFLWGLTYLHKHQLAHCDLGLRNMMIFFNNEKWRGYLIDYGTISPVWGINLGTLWSKETSDKLGSYPWPDRRFAEILQILVIGLFVIWPEFFLMVMKGKIPFKWDDDFLVDKLIKWITCESFIKLPDSSAKIIYTNVCRLLMHYKVIIRKREDIWDEIKQIGDSITADKILKAFTGKEIELKKKAKIILYGSKKHVMTAEKIFMMPIVYKKRKIYTRMPMQFNILLRAFISVFKDIRDVNDVIFLAGIYVIGWNPNWMLKEWTAEKTVKIMKMIMARKKFFQEVAPILLMNKKTTPSDYTKRFLRETGRKIIIDMTIESSIIEYYSPPMHFTRFFNKKKIPDGHPLRYLYKVF